MDSPDAASRIELEAARGEVEAAQLVVWTTGKRVAVTMELTALVGPGGARIDTSRVQVYLQQPMVVETGSPAGRSGTYLDPLLPAEGQATPVSDRERAMAWVDVSVPVDARPGAYAGEMLVRASPVGRDTPTSVMRVPVSVRVRSATIPHVPTLASHVGLDVSQMVRFEQVKPGTRALRDVNRQYAKLLADARLSAGDVGALPPGSERSAGPAAAGIPGDARYLRDLFSQRGVASVRIPFYLDHPFADPLGRDRPRAIAYLRNAGAWARRNGWADRAYVFAIDEPGDERALEVRELHELVRAASPWLPLLVTRESTAPGFQGSVDIWAPNISPDRFRVADVRREARAGHDTWWYPSITTWQPYPTLFIDELRPTPRALGWLAWQAGVRGLLYWSATHWHEVDDPWRDPGTYNETDAVGNGDGVLVYPGGPIGRPGRPAPSVRLLQLRDGIEDHDLLTMAACGATPAQRRQLAAAVRTAVPAIDEIDPNPEQVRALRSTAFRILDRRTASLPTDLVACAEATR